MFDLLSMARPREFNHEIVSERIMNLFWAKGFEGTTIDEIVKVTGLKKGSLYSSFGSKTKLFEFALERYCAPKNKNLFPERSPLETLAYFLLNLINEADLPKAKRRGCFLMNSALEFGNKNHELTPMIMNLIELREQYFRRLMDEAKMRREIPQKINSQEAAQRAFATAFTIRGMCKFKPDKKFLTDVANSFFESLGTNMRVVH